MCYYCRIVDVMVFVVKSPVSHCLFTVTSCIGEYKLWPRSPFGPKSVLLTVRAITLEQAKKNKSIISWFPRIAVLGAVRTVKASSRSYKTGRTRLWWLCTFLGIIDSCSEHILFRFEKEETKAVSITGCSNTCLLHPHTVTERHTHIHKLEGSVLVR